MIRDHLKQGIALGAVLLVIALLFANWAAEYVRAEHTLFAWDYFLFWNMSANLALQAHQSILTAIVTFGWAMHHDYNLNCTLPATCMMALFGTTSRLCYVLSNVLFLVIPTALLGVALWVRGSLASWSQVAFCALAFLGIMAAPLPWVVTLGGESDVGGLIMALIATDLLSRTEVRSHDATRWLAIGAAMGCLALSKRWFLFYVSALIALMLVEVALDLIATFRRAGSFVLGPVWQAAYGPFLCGCGLVGVYMLSFPMPLRIATTDYSGLYSAYQSGTTYLSAAAINIESVVQRFGVAQVILSFACFVAALFFASMRRRALYLFLPGLAALFNFSRVQTMNEHHMLLLFIALVVTPFFFARELAASLLPRAATWGWTVLAVAVLVGCLNFQSVFLSPPLFGSTAVAPLFSQPPLQPIQRGDLTEIENLLRFFADKLDNPPGQPPVNKVYLLSSSTFFNSSLLASAAFQLGESLPGVYDLCNTRDVDRRDGFPDDLATVAMVVVADPIQTHLDKGQNVVTVPAGMFLSGQGIAQAFARDPRTFQLDQGVRLLVFNRIRPSTPEEMAQLRAATGFPAEKKQP